MPCPTSRASTTTLITTPRSEPVKNPYHFFSGRADINLSVRDKLTVMGRQSLYLQYDNDIFHNLAYLNHGLGRDIWGGRG